MAKNIEMQYYDGSTYDICYPYTLWGNVYETYGGTTLATAITNINSQITTLNSQVGGFGSSISSINSSIQALDERVTVFEESMASKNATETITVSLKGSFNCSQNYWSPEPSISMNTASQNYSYCTLNLTYPTGNSYGTNWRYWYYSGPAAITIKIGETSPVYNFKMGEGEYDGQYGGVCTASFSFTGKLLTFASYGVYDSYGAGSTYFNEITASAYMFNM